MSAQPASERGSTHLPGVRGMEALISEESERMMKSEQLDLTSVLTSPDGLGLGWMREDWSGTPVYGHDGDLRPAVGRGQRRLETARGGDL